MAARAHRAADDNFVRLGTVRPLNGEKRSDRRAVGPPSDRLQNDFKTVAPLRSDSETERTRLNRLPQSCAWLSLAHLAPTRHAITILPALLQESFMRIDSQNRIAIATAIQ